MIPWFNTMGPKISFPACISHCIRDLHYSTRMSYRANNDQRSLWYHVHLVLVCGNLTSIWPRIGKYCSESISYEVSRKEFCKWWKLSWPPTGWYMQYVELPHSFNTFVHLDFQFWGSINMLGEIGVIVDRSLTSTRALWISMVTIRYDRIKPKYLVLHVVMVYNMICEGNYFYCW